jgi:hypothetical protein
MLSKLRILLTELLAAVAHSGTLQAHAWFVDLHLLLECHAPQKEHERFVAQAFIYFWQEVHQVA